MMEKQGSKGVFRHTFVGYALRSDAHQGFTSFRIVREASRAVCDTLLQFFPPYFFHSKKIPEIPRNFALSNL